MNNNKTQIANSTSETSKDNTDDEVSIDQLISVGIVTTSPVSMHLNTTNAIPTRTLLISNQSRDEILIRQREARRRRRRRRAQRRREQRAERQHQEQLAQQIRGRQTANQYVQQQQYHRYSWYEEREQERQRDQERHDYIQRRSPTFNEFFEEVIEERLLEAYNWETMHPRDRWDQEQLYELEGIAALEQLALIQDEMNQSQHIHALEASQIENEKRQKQTAEEWDQAQLHAIENHSTSRSFDSILDHIEQMQEIDEMERSQEAQQQRQYDHLQMQLQRYEESDCQLEDLNTEYS